ncbi:Hypothetical predicted protein [Paramuricea clavata]|uniref:Mutator-like transposase domain-containing protein n=1 Tax=Paramuricea clavata TaxID=317549 RepID=A0A7D9HEG3_PARCT|nr:Hypothetical predicted protein [Paramuricea clavata]
MPKGSKEGTKLRVRNKSTKKNLFKGKRFADLRKDGENIGSQSASQQNAITQDRVINNEDLVTVKSTSARKLENASSELPQTPEFTRQNSQEEKDGYWIVYIENIRKAVETMHKCKNGTIITCEDASKRAGLSSSYYFECTKCRQKVDMDTSKPVEGKARSFDVNRRTNFAMGELGLGREALATICKILNMPPPVSDSAYQKHNRSVNLATRKVLEERLNDAGHRVRTFLQKDDAEILDVAVSFDGTWSKRGFTANYGVGIVISADTGEVLDYVVLSKVCELCKAAEKHKSNPEKYQEWKDAHAASGLCQKNYNGSSPAMEKEAARILWSRYLSRSASSGILIWYVMVIARHMEKCGIYMGFVMIVRNMKIWTNSQQSTKSG